MGFRYRFSKNIQITVAALVLVAAVIFVGSAVTSYIVYRQDLGARLSETEQQLSEITSDLGICTSELGKNRESLASCESLYKNSQSELGRCETERNSIKNDLTLCQNNSSALQSSLNTEKQNYDAVVKSSAVAVCCRRGIETANYAVVSNEIICAGNLTVNCTG